MVAFLSGRRSHEAARVGEAGGGLYRTSCVHMRGQVRQAHRTVLTVAAETCPLDRLAVASESPHRTALMGAVDLLSQWVRWRQ